MSAPPPASEGASPAPGRAAPAAGTRILIVEDDFGIASNLHTFLALKGFDVDAAYSGQAALHRCSVDRFDVVLLDLGLPGLDGLTFLQRLRGELRSATPVLVISARSELADKLAGFAHGADDYLTKPFALAEVEARVRALLNRSVGGRLVDPVLRFGSVELDRERGEVRVAGALVRLTPKAGQLLELLLRKPGQLVRRTTIEATLWPDAPPQADALRSQIHSLRKALAEHGFEGLETVHGVGLRLVETGRQGD
jgi:DNA-binding response OmpR family regulator